MLVKLWALKEVDAVGLHRQSGSQAVRHTCSGNTGIVKILRYIRPDMYTASAKHFFGRKKSPPVKGGPVLKHT